MQGWDRGLYWDTSLVFKFVLDCIENCGRYLSVSHESRYRKE